LVDKDNSRASRLGFRLAEIISSCETLEELGHCARTMDSLLPIMLERMRVREMIKK